MKKVLFVFSIALSVVAMAACGGKKSAEGTAEIKDSVVCAASDTLKSACCVKDTTKACCKEKSECPKSLEEKTECAKKEAAK